MKQSVHLRMASFFYIDKNYDTILLFDKRYTP
jgi:hypothetical protein